jgi:phage gp45-like
MTDNRLEITNAEVSTLSVYNLKGSQISLTEGNQAEIDNLGKGIYIVRAKLTNGDVESWKIER